MFHLELNAEERELLREILDGCASDLRMEIAHTDRQDFRARLKRRKDVLNKVLAALETAAPPAREALP